MKQFLLAMQQESFEMDVAKPRGQSYLILWVVLVELG